MNRLNDLRRIAALGGVLAAALLAAGCQTPDGAPPKVEEIRWITGTFADGQVTMELPGKSSRNLRPHAGELYGRLLEKRWVTLTVGYYPISEVSVYVGGSPDIQSMFDEAHDLVERVREEYPKPAGQLFIEQWGGAGLGSTKYRLAVVVLPDGKRGVMIDFCTDPTSRDSGDSGKFHHRRAIDDGIFGRMMDSLRLNGAAPPRKVFGRGKD